MPHPPFRPRALGEIAIRCRDFAAMQDFYGRILGLERLTPGSRGGHRAGIVFFRLGESFGGHVAVLALFADEAGGISMSPERRATELEAGQRSSLHHLALSLPWAEQEAAADWLRQEGCEVRFETFQWTGWRGLFTRDPDGNTVELVAADADWHNS
ncbi:VOC family protein [Dinoroseobacter sp. S375]|uniref:VOC family protein n=1 Tax=Dinoroseobacter sp. S375 TaxID=3415136 RepID=UPI003C7ED7A2